MNILYTCDNEGPALMQLDELLANFDSSNAWEHRATKEDLTFEVNNRGWYEGLHENGRYLVVNLDKLQLTPTPEGWDGIYSSNKQKG